MVEKEKTQTLGQGGNIKACWSRFRKFRGSTSSDTIVVKTNGSLTPQYARERGGRQLGSVSVARVSEIAL